MCRRVGVCDDKRGGYHYQHKAPDTKGPATGDAKHCEEVEIQQKNHAKAIHPQNNFDALRIAAALMVLFSHHYTLAGMGQPFLILNRTLGELAVEAFFAISGYLIAISWENDPNLLRFALKRVLRVWPGLLVMLILSVIVLGLFFSDAPRDVFFKSQVTRDYLLRNSVLNITYRLPQTFASNPFPDAVNGSLWTLPYEVRWYLYLGILGLLRLTRFRFFMLSVWIVMFANYVFIFNVDVQLAHGGDHHFSAELGLFFLGGALMHYFRDFCSRHCRLFWLGLLLASLLLLYAGNKTGFLSLVLPAVVITFGRAQTPMIYRAGGWGDPSYGIYVYAFVIQQALSVPDFGPHNFYWSLLFATAITTVLGYTSWHLIEGPALGVGHRILRRQRREYVALSSLPATK